MSSNQEFNSFKDETKGYLRGYPEEIVRLYFKRKSGKFYDLYNYQGEIIRIIFWKSPSYNTILGCRRAGKSECIAIGAILLAMFRTGENIKIVAPTKKKSQIIMNYILKHLSDHHYILRSLDDISRSKDDLKNQLSKERITWKTGSEISILTANISGDGRSVVGKGATTLIVDEAELIPPNIVRSNILTMLGDNSEDFLVLLVSNAVDYGFIYENKDNERWSHIRIDWRDAVKAGQLSKKFVEDRREEMTSNEFTIWYEARYPEKMEKSLFKREWIRKAIQNNIDAPEIYLESPEKNRSYGLDVARGGADNTVLTKVLKIQDNDPKYVVRSIKKWDEADTSKTAKMIANEISSKNIPIKIDAVGVGGPVGDKLEEIGYRVIDIKVSEDPINDPEDRFLNKKSEGYWKLRQALEEERIDLPNNKELKTSLMNLKYDLNSKGKIVIEDPSKSPDTVDSLMLALYNAKNNRNRVANSKIPPNKDHLTNNKNQVDNKGRRKPRF